MNLRDYQQRLVAAVFAAWEVVNYILAVLPTGGGKTVTFAHIIKLFNRTTLVLAHRAELVTQMSLALAREGIRHRVIGPKVLASFCVRAHVDELGYSLIDPTAKVGVGSVQTVAAREDPWFREVTLWVHDEAHHLLKDNEFGRAVGKLPNAKGLGVTATPGRADGKGLGAHADGYFEQMVMGPTPRELMDMGYLSQYKIFCPPSNLNLADVKVTASGDFSRKELRAATQRSTVLGDVVSHYLKHAYNKLGLTFADSIENAGIMAARFRDAGIAAEVLTGKTDPGLRSSVIKRFKARDVKQILSVALIDEGFDCPGVEVVSDGAASESLNRFMQRFGRGWRPHDSKPYMIYFDHVGNVMRHGLPDSPREWSLDRRERRSKKSDAIPLRVCVACLQPYEAVSKRCPYCDHYEPPASRSAPEFVDGDLTELDPAILAALRGEISRIDGDFHAPHGLSLPAQMGARKNHQARQEGQRELRNAIAWWAGLEAARGHGESESYRRFFFRFGVDVANAQTLGAREAGELTQKVNSELQKHGVRVDEAVN